MWFIGFEVEQETSVPPPKKKILDPPLWIKWIMQLVPLTLIRWIVIYLVDSAIQLLNNRGLFCCRSHVLEDQNLCDQITSDRGYKRM